MTTCPSDSAPCEQIKVHLAGSDIVAQQCEKCQGIWLDKRYLEMVGAKQAQKLDQGRVLPKVRVFNKICPRCQYLLQPSTSIQDDRNLGAQECFDCGLLWLPPGTLRSAYRIAQPPKAQEDSGNPKQLLKYYSTSYLAIFGMLVGLSAWQGGAMRASADWEFTNQLSNVGLVSIAIWLVAFFILFSAPLSIYLQIVLQEKHISSAIKHPLAYILPAIAVLVALVNLAVFAPSL